MIFALALVNALVTQEISYEILWFMHTSYCSSSFFFFPFFFFLLWCTVFGLGRIKLLKLENPLWSDAILFVLVNCSSCLKVCRNMRNEIWTGKYSLFLRSQLYLFPQSTVVVWNVQSFEVLSIIGWHWIGCRCFWI